MIPRYLPRINNKKADLSVVAFVFLTLLLCSYTLYMLAINKTKVNQKITEFDSAEKLLLDEKDLQYRLEKMGEECVVESFGASEVTYMGEEYLKWIEERSERNFIEIVEKCIKEKAKISHDFLDKSQTDSMIKSNFLAKLKDGTNLNLKSDSEKIDITLQEFPISWLNQDNTYIIDLKAKIILNRIGLIHPQEFKKIVECKEDKTCIDGITKNLFDVQTDKVKIGDLDYLRYKIKSEKEFLFGTEFKKINITFLVETTN